jgi:hypothetical protein
MSAEHRMPSLGSGLAAALLLSAAGAALIATLAPWFGHGGAARIAIALLGLSYTLYVIGRSGERVGRIATIVCWLGIAAAVSIAGLPLTAYVLVHLCLVWLVRSLYCYSGLLPALADLALTALGAAFAVWAALRSESAWLALWCFFLAQAFHVLIPASLQPSARSAGNSADDAFARAQRAAEAAVRRMSSAAR